MEKAKFPNPLLIGHNSLLEHLQRLHSRLLFYIENYPMKSTAVYPSRECLCLPDRYVCLTFKGQIISKRVDAELLTSPERKLLFRAFLGHELKQVYFECEGDSQPLQELLIDDAFHQYAGQEFQPRESDALACV